MQARKVARVPDSSYDFDGDGVVGSLDFFIGRNFDKDCDGKLNSDERRQAEQALESGFLDRFHRGYDATAPKHRQGMVQQRRGAIITSDNAAEICNLTYPPHHNAHKVPEHGTNTALKKSRKAEAKGAGNEIGERYAKEMAPVPEPIPPNARSHPRLCEVENIRERAMADNQAARYHAGLQPMPAGVNPEREQRDIGLEYVASPPVGTRSQLLSLQKDVMRWECEEQRARGEAVQVPLSVRQGALKATWHEYSEGTKDSMTLTKLKDQRKRDKIEYDMANFEQPRVLPRSYPRFADHGGVDVPFWTIGKEPQPQAGTESSEQALARAVSEPVFKVTELPYHGDRKGQDMTGQSVQAQSTEADYKDWAASDKDPLRYLGSNTKKRFTAEMLDRGQGRNQPRYFDNIQPIRVSPKDLEDLDVTSSMETIRKRAIRERNATSQKNAELPRTSALARKDTAEGRHSSSGVTMHQPRSGALSRSSTQKEVRPVFLEPEREDTKAMRVYADATHRKRRTNIGPPTSISDPHLLRGGASMDMVDNPSAEPRFFGQSRPIATFKGGIRSGGFQHVDLPTSTAVVVPAHSTALSKPGSPPKTRQRSDT